jgi:hypothetical protein
VHHAGGESTRAHKNSDVGGFYRGTRARGTPTRCRYALQEVTAPPLAGLGAVIMRDLTVRDCAHTYGEPPRGRRSQGAKDRLGPCARIANLQADAEHTEREMALAALLRCYVAETPFPEVWGGFRCSAWDLSGGWTFGPIGRPAIAAGPADH